MLSLAALSAVVFATAPAIAEDAGTWPKALGGESASIPDAQREFRDTGARGMDSKAKIEFSEVFGDSLGSNQKGVFFLFAPGYRGPVHARDFDYYAIVVKGTLQNFEVGTKPVNMGPGSYWYQAGKKEHTTNCVSKTPCEIFIVQSKTLEVQTTPTAE
jgi:quercetin dioxygenase-like cupin family protein